MTGIGIFLLNIPHFLLTTELESHTVTWIVYCFQSWIYIICYCNYKANRCLRFQWIANIFTNTKSFRLQIFPLWGAFSKPWHRRAHLDDHKAIPGNIETLNMEELRALCRRFNIEISGGNRRNRLCSHPKQSKIGKRKQINTKMSQGSSETQDKVKEREGLDWLDENKKTHTNLTQVSVQFSSVSQYLIQVD